MDGLLMSSGAVFRGGVLIHLAACYHSLQQKMECPKCQGQSRLHTDEQFSRRHHYYVAPLLQLPSRCTRGSGTAGVAPLQWGTHRCKQVAIQMQRRCSKRPLPRLLPPLRPKLIQKKKAKGSSESDSCEATVRCKLRCLGSLRHHLGFQRILLTMEKVFFHLSCKFLRTACALIIRFDAPSNLSFLLVNFSSNSYSGQYAIIIGFDFHSCLFTKLH